MARAREQPDREDRILFDIVVDAYNETERAMGWYCYLQEQQFPFTAVCKSVRSTTPIDVGSEVRVLSMAPDDDCMYEVFVMIEHGKSKLAVPLAQLECKSPDKETCQAVADWHYWVARGYEF